VDVRVGSSAYRGLLIPLTFFFFSAAARFQADP